MLKFPKEDRILSFSDYDRVKRKGMSLSAGPLRVGFLPAKKKRLGIVVGKQCGNSVLRNRFKRVIREHFRMNKEIYPMGDVVIVARAKIANLENADIRSVLKRALERLGSE